MLAKIIIYFDIIIFLFIVFKTFIKKFKSNI